MGSPGVQLRPFHGHVPGAAGLALTLILEGLPAEQEPWVQPAGGACLVFSWASSVMAGCVAKGKEPARRPAWVLIAALPLASYVVGVAGTREVLRSCFPQDAFSREQPSLCRRLSFCEPAPFSAGRGFKCVCAVLMYVHVSLQPRRGRGVRPAQGRPVASAPG